MGVLSASTTIFKFYLLYLYKIEMILQNKTKNIFRAEIKKGEFGAWYERL